MDPHSWYSAVGMVSGFSLYEAILEAISFYLTNSSMSSQSILWISAQQNLQRYPPSEHFTEHHTGISHNTSLVCNTDALN